MRPAALDLFCGAYAPFVHPCMSAPTRPALRCILCGGPHEPHPAVCSDEGMDAVIAAVGARKWNRLLAGMAMRKLNAVTRNHG